MTGAQHVLTVEYIYLGCGEEPGASLIFQSALATVFERGMDGSQRFRAGSAESLPEVRQPGAPNVPGRCLVGGGEEPALGRAVGTGEQAGTQQQRNPTSLLYLLAVAAFPCTLLCSWVLEGLMTKHFLLSSEH